MTPSQVCPDCGHQNPPDAVSCEQCSFPLRADAPPDEPSRAAAPVPTTEPGLDPGAPGAGAATDISSPGDATAPGAPLAGPPRRLRPPRPRPLAGQAVSLWLLFGTFMAAALIYTAVKANLDRANEPVEGAKPDQQKRADELRQVLAKDSNDVAVRIELANVLYDTGNWPDAIVHYRAALRRDSTQAGVIVDLGVCYYNLGDSRQAQLLFEQAIRRDPHQPVALFNLGIVSERQERFDTALQFYHRALQSSPPEEMKPVLLAAMERVQQKTGRKPPPLPDGAR